VIFGCRCSTSKPTLDPLAGWRPASHSADKAIVDDYQNYIQTLSPEEKKYLGPSPAGLFEDGTGQHAIQITVGINGTVWRHVLIYDKDNKRIKTIKYASGDYMS
jgi:hypothetical protein